MKVIEYASGEPQICGALSAATVAITCNTVRPPILMATFLPAPTAASAWAERAFILLTRDRQSTSANRLEETANRLDDLPVAHFKILALSFVCAVIGPAVAVLIFVLANNNWG